MEWLIPIIICVLVGVVLLVVEVFMPGFGIPGISAAVLLLAGIVMTWYEYGAKIGLAVAVAVLALMGVVISISLKSVKSGKLAKTELMLNGTVNDGGKSEREQVKMLMGKEGMALTPLRPVGAVEFDCGKMNVQSDGEFIEKGAKVRVIKINGTTIYVKEV
ncbi:MAG: hypothetical protein IJ214_06795 [Clostridia bacterium]|nr:hypothetical protein [Clostridia bacterium]